MTHTPGPWSTRENGGWQKMIMAGKHIITYSTGENQKEEVEANARLIAAAPDMLEALDGLVGIGIMNPTGSPTLDKLIDQAEAAIARAKGTE